MEEGITLTSSKTTWRRSPGKTSTSAAALILFLLVILYGLFMSSIVVFISTSDSPFEIMEKFEGLASTDKKVSSPLNCTDGALAQACSNNYYPQISESKNLSAEACPEYFRWIHEDLRPWKDTGITREVLERDKHLANFRLIILNGKAYLDPINKAWQTRDVLTIWGIVQLLRLYPRKIPDLELVFQCDDQPVISKRDFEAPGTIPTPWFHFCGNESTHDIPFPDWSYWGWPEVNIKPWERIIKGIRKGAKKKEWKDKIPYAYWKGNPYVAPKRIDLLMKCHKSLLYDWNARLYKQDWIRETAEGFKHSNLEDQCNYRYNIYIEGRAWSVSQKYIMACGGMTLYIKPKHYDFFARGLIPMEHYWPIRPEKKCRDIKFAVEWGNNHTKEAQTIGENGREFVEKELSLKYVYDYMFHLLSEYAKLQKYKPTVPPGAIELCSEPWACSTSGLLREFMIETMVKSSGAALPCTLPPPYDPQQLKEFLEKKDNITRQVEKWEDEYWEREKEKDWWITLL